MKFNTEKKKSIIICLLEKIDQKDRGISKSVSEAFSVNQNTIHTYINELVDENVIRRIKRGQYELVKSVNEYYLKRADGDLDTDTYAYDHYLECHISGLDSNIQAIWNYAFSEIINNVMEHSDASEVKVLVEKDYLNTRVTIADNGVGIFNKIKKYFGFASLEEAICELFKGKLTTDSKNHSGEGIFFTSKMMDTFFIVSGGKIFTNNKYDDSRVMSIAAEKQEGTCVIMSLSNFTRKIPKEIFDLYANIDGGFVKTRIPIKNIFDSSPVSRSQAKRVCNRLETFEEVTIDFDGVEWMGQGFAHQLFVVFANEHSEIQLIPINMNEDITRMHHHVTME